MGDFDRLFINSLPPGLQPGQVVEIDGSCYIYTGNEGFVNKTLSEAPTGVYDSCYDCVTDQGLPIESESWVIEDYEHKEWVDVSKDKIYINPFDDINVGCKVILNGRGYIKTGNLGMMTHMLSTQPLTSGCGGPWDNTEIFEWVEEGEEESAAIEPENSATPTLTPTQTPTPSVTPTQTPSPSVTPTQTPTQTGTQTPTPTPTSSPPVVQNCNETIPDDGSTIPAYVSMTGWADDGANLDRTPYNTVYKFFTAGSTIPLWNGTNTSQGDPMYVAWDLVNNYATGDLAEGAIMWLQAFAAGGNILDWQFTNTGIYNNCPNPLATGGWGDSWDGLGTSDPQVVAYIPS